MFQCQKKEVKGPTHKRIHHIVTTHKISNGTGVILILNYKKTHSLRDHWQFNEFKPMICQKKHILIAIQVSIMNV